MSKSEGNPKSEAKVGAALVAKASPRVSRKAIKPGVNSNRIATDEFSNVESSRLYQQQWPTEPAIRSRYEEGEQCGGCSYFAPLNADWGVCCRPKSRHHLETVFEHFTCPSYIAEGWGPHSFSERTCCQCGGSDYTKERRRLFRDLTLADLTQQLLPGASKPVAKRRDAQ